MKKIVDKLIIVTLLFICGCQTYKIENIYDEQKKSTVSVLKNVELDSDIHVRRPLLSLRKIDGNLVAIWVKYSALNNERVPSKQPQVIVKGLLKNKLMNQVRLTAKYLTFNDLLANEFCKYNQQPSELSVEDVNIATEIWSFNFKESGTMTLYKMDQLAIYFTITKNDYLSMIQSDKIEILVETNFQPLKFELNQENLKPLIEFKKYL